MSPFKQRIIELVRVIPPGKVVSYGQVGLYIGVPRAARQVGWVLNSTEGKIDLPWWRVVNNAGRISIKGTKFNDRELQRKLLRAEGIIVQEDFTFAIEQYRFRPDRDFLKKFALDEGYIDMLLAKYTE